MFNNCDGKKTVKWIIWIAAAVAAITAAVTAFFVIKEKQKREEPKYITRFPRSKSLMTR